jgi:hypothetical protein
MFFSHIKISKTNCVSNDVFISFSIEKRFFLMDIVGNKRGQPSISCFLDNHLIIDIDGRNITVIS